MWFNIALALQETARRHPDRLAVRGPRPLTYGELNRASNCVANGLAALGLRPGDRAAFILPNVPEFLVLLYGILKMGGVAVPISPVLKAREIQQTLTDCGAVALFAWHSYLHEAQQGLAGAEGCGLIVVGDEEEAALPEGMLPLAALMAQAAGDHEVARRSPDDTAMIVYTSGTTGQAKGAELSHLAAFLSALVRSGAEPNVGAQHVRLETVPLAGAMGLLRVHGTVYLGGSLYLMERFDAVQALTDIQRERVAALSTVPPVYASLMQEMQARPYDVSSIVSCMIAGAAAPPGLMETIKEKFGITPMVAYGATEAGPVAATTQQDPLRPGLGGRPLWGVEVRIADAEDKPLPVGVPGEILVRSPMAMKGYYRRPQETDEVMRNGWLHTGDVGYLDASGYLYVTDRKKTMINRGGFKVYPAEVEAVLVSHPAVAEAAVVGVPDSVRGEEVKAFVVLRPSAAATADEIVAYCRQRMATYKVPRLVEFRTHLPRNAQGKIIRGQLG